MGWSQLRSARACKPADVQIAATRLLTELEDALAWSTMRTATGPAGTARLRSLPETLAAADDDDDGSVLSLRRVRDEELEIYFDFLMGFSPALGFALS